MIRFRSMFLCLTMLSLAAVGFAVSPGGSVHGSGGVNGKAIVGGHEGPAMLDLSGMTETSNPDITQSELNATLSANSSQDSGAFSLGSSAGASRPQAQHPDILRNSRKEQKSGVELLKVLKVTKRDHLIQARETGVSGEEESASNHLYLLALLALLLPPLIVYLDEGEISNNFYLAVALTLCFWFPGMIFATAKVLR